jgi:hypothetical protein
MVALPPSQGGMMRRSESCYGVMQGDLNVARLQVLKLRFETIAGLLYIRCIMAETPPRLLSHLTSPRPI